MDLNLRDNLGVVPYTSPVKWEIQLDCDMLYGAHICIYIFW